MQYTSIVTHQFEGFHKWPEAPLSRKYLQSKHRHMFHVLVEVKGGVKREVEFHQLKDHVKEVCVRLTSISAFEDWGCEEIATEILLRIQKFKYEVVKVEVWEDGECGAKVVP